MAAEPEDRRAGKEIRHVWDMKTTMTDIRQDDGDDDDDDDGDDDDGDDDDDDGGGDDGDDDGHQPPLTLMFFLRLFCPGDCNACSLMSLDLNPNSFANGLVCNSMLNVSLLG